MSEKRFSFAKPGATAPAPQPVTPVTQVDVASADNVATPETPQNLPATQQAYAPPAFYTGEEDDCGDASDVRLPRLNIVQKSSASGWLKHGVGSLLLKGEVPIGRPARVVVAGARPKIWIEKTKYQPGGGGPQARIARSIDEVARLGGTDQWKFSKENEASGSTKPWFMPSVTLAVLIERPENCLPEHADYFGIEANGKYYAAALTSVKSTNYEALWVSLVSEKRGLLSEGFNSRFISLDVLMKPFKGGESGVFQVKFLEKTSPELRAVAAKLVA